MGCEAGLNFNCPKGPEKLMVRGEGLGVGGGARTHREQHKQTLIVSYTSGERSANAGGAPRSARGAAGPGGIPVPGSGCPAPGQALRWPPPPSL